MEGQLRRKDLNAEHLKLIANGLDRVSTACFAFGIIGPMAAVTFGLSSASFWPLIIGTVIWFFFGIGLHVVAHVILEGMQDDPY